MTISIEEESLGDSDSEDTQLDELDDFIHWYKENKDENSPILFIDEPWEEAIHQYIEKGIH